MNKVCAKMYQKMSVLPRLTKKEGKRERKICSDLSEKQPNLLDRTMTAYETWVFQYDTKTNCQHLQWKSTVLQD
jgi:hypothetical protein